MLDNLKFAQYVNEERKKLIKSTRERGVYVEDNATLSEIVARNSEIQPYEATSTDKVSVTFLDADGTLLKREYLDIGGTATAPSNPTLDSNYLTFSGWSDTELTNITENKIIYATYTTKDNATYIFIHIPTTNKAISLGFSGTVTSVDWGDGTTNTTKSHTYSAIGDYVIKVISVNAKLYNKILGSSNGSCVLKCYVSSTITTIDYQAFSSCYSLTNIILPNSIIRIGQDAFAYCRSLTKIIIPDSVISLEINAFAECPLKSIFLPNSITKIDSYAFKQCHSLTSINLPNSITNINNDAFQECQSLTNIVLPNRITKLSSNTFYRCHSLTKITLPSNITSIAENAFYSCYNLKQVIINADTVITIQSDSFSTDAYNTKFYVPDNLVEDYKVATNWVKFADRIYPLSSLGV